MNLYPLTVARVCAGLALLLASTALPAGPLRVCDGHEPPVSLDPMAVIAWKAETIMAHFYFHDGRPFDAAVVKWNFDTLRKLGPASPRNFVYAAVDHAQVVADDIVDLVLRSPDHALPHKLAGATMIVPPTEPGSDAWRRLAREPVGTGPYLRLPSRTGLPTGRLRHARPPSLPARGGGVRPLPGEDPAPG